MATIIGLKELREHTTEIAERVTRGESFTVVKRSQPIFEINPITQDPSNRQQEVSEWTESFIARYRPTFTALADK